jgi:putative colanic acid biosynthesis UDP-glucose lipid carrier transferase
MNARLPSIPAGGSANSSLLKRPFQVLAPSQRPVEFLESFLDPLALIGSLWALAVYFEGKVSNPYLLLGFVVFSMTFPGPSYLRVSWTRMVGRIALGWIVIGALLLVFGYAAHLIDEFDRTILMEWVWVGPLSLLLARVGLRLVAPWLAAVQANTRRVVIAGANEQGLALAARIAEDPLSEMKVVGFFDDRSRERLPESMSLPLLGRLGDLPHYAQTLGADVIFLSLPMATQPRILNLLDELRDTTASIYFVPDFFVTDLIQGRMGTVNGLPVVAICESPFTGGTGIIKRISDIILSLVILILTLPLMSLIAIGVKATSPGPLIFKQRRYGLDGKEILVYKFRSMSVCEDSGVIVQAQRGDQRITPFGAFLRKSSLDELPQFINVLQGRMSIVGPRPHAVAHNELYRKLIKGYMVRHKVKPGITGWAQVNGLRGETETLDKMQARIDHDLDYLRNWSLRFDLYIIYRSVAVVLKDCNAY